MTRTVAQIAWYNKVIELVTEEAVVFCLKLDLFPYRTIFENIYVDMYALGLPIWMGFKHYHTIYNSV